MEAWIPSKDGIREFIAGTGGAPGDGYTHALHPLQSNEVIRNQIVMYGLLELTSFKQFLHLELPAGSWLYFHQFFHDCLLLIGLPFHNTISERHPN